MEQKINELSERLKLAITVVENVAAEISDLKNQLAAENDRKAQLEPDMQDPNNWQAGDIIAATDDCRGDFRRGSQYVAAATPENGIVHVLHDDSLKPNGWFANNFIWIGRPSPEALDMPVFNRMIFDKPLTILPGQSLEITHDTAGNVISATVADE